MLHDEKQFEDIAGRLKDELSLVSDEEYYPKVLNEAHEIYDYLQKEYQKDLAEIELTENDLSLLDFIKDRLPHSFWVLNELDEETYVYNPMACWWKSFDDIIDEFVYCLYEGGWDGEIKEDKSRRYEFDEDWSSDLKDEELEDVLMLVGSLLKGRHCLEKEALMRKIIDDQPHQNKIVIMKYILSNTDDVYMLSWHSMCFDILKDSWWDDALIPVVEDYRGDARESDRASVIALRFPYDYVLEHRERLEVWDYESVCCRLAKEKEFVIDKSRLSRSQYFSILAKNHIHVEDSEADRLLFEHIKLWLLAGRNYLFNKDWIDWGRYVGLDNYRFNYKHWLVFWFEYKPSLYELPLVKNYALDLCSMGNTNTLAKLITWDHFLRSNIKSMIEEIEIEVLKVESVTEVFIENIDRMSRRFLELAIETCPFETDQIESEFLYSEVDDYADVFRKLDSSYYNLPGIYF